MIKTLKRYIAAKKFRDTLCNMIDDEEVAIICVGLGSKEVEDKYGFKQGNYENYIADIVIEFYRQAKEIKEIKEQNEQLKGKLKSLSL